MSSYADVTAKNASQTPQEVRNHSYSPLSLFSKFKRRRRRSFAGNKSSRTVGGGGGGAHHGFFRTLSRTHPSTPPSAKSISSTKSSPYSAVVTSSPTSTCTSSTSPVSQRSLAARGRRHSIKSIRRKLSTAFSNRRRRDSTSSSLTRLPSTVSRLLSNTTTDREADTHVNCSIVSSTTVSTTTPPWPLLLVADFSTLNKEDCIGNPLTFSSSQKAAKPVPELETTTTSKIAPSSMEPVESPSPPPAAAEKGSAETEKSADISSDKAFPELPPSHDVPASGPDKGKKPKSREYSYLVSAFDSLKKFVARVGADAGTLAYNAKTELKNPVVACNLGTWVAIIAGATYYFNIRKGALPSAFTGPNGKYVTAAAITCALALTAGDVIVSTKRYPKYSKK
ncbi:hypothetical protein V1509DRAFT_673497 [Lipomyces kononenkoae]